MALVMFFLVERNSSSFSAMRRSISCLTWVSSSWHLSTLFSSCSRAPSASERAASLANLVHDVLDLVAQGLVLPPNLIQLEDRLLVGGLDTEQLRGGVAGLLLGRVKIHANAVNLLLPLTNNSVELLGLLLH